MAQSQPAGAYIFPQTAPVTEFYSIAPGQILTLDVAGLSVTPNAPLSATSLPLPTSLAGISAQIMDRAGTVTLVPLLGVVGTSNCYDSLYPNPPCSNFLAVTVEIPTELAASDPSNDGATFLDQLVMSDQYGNRASLAVIVNVDAIQGLTYCAPGYNGCQPLVTTPAGAVVSVVHGGDVVVAYFYGLGHTLPSVPSGSPAPFGTVTTASPQGINFDFSPNAGPLNPPRVAGPLTGYDLMPFAAPLFAGQTPGYVGLYQVNLRIPPVPAGTPPCGPFIGSNLTITVIGQISLAGFGLCAE